jgi:hypothetical protein
LGEALLDDSAGLVREQRLSLGETIEGLLDRRHVPSWFISSAIRFNDPSVANMAIWRRPDEPGGNRSAHRVS